MPKRSLAQRFATLRQRALDRYDYFLNGVWRDTRTTWRVQFTKTLSLSVRSFLNADLQSQACALTFRTLLAVVPALAMVFAIGRGFGFQESLTRQLYDLFPSQHQALEMAIGFVDSCLAQASEGLFVGVGIVFLIWTLISLLGSVESSFNSIWRVKTGRSLWRKATDYLAIMLILPILLICSGGITVLMSTTLKTLLPFEMMAPAISCLIDAIGWVLTWLFFTGTYMLIPNYKVKFRNAFLSGALVGTAFQVLQWLFMTGQMYVAKYNAIYGSFSFLPLLMIWMQLVWLITLIGAMLCYASQNIGQFNFADDIARISRDYRREVQLTVMTLITKRFASGKKPLTVDELSQKYGLPVSLSTELVRELHDMHLINFLKSDGELTEHPMQPAVDISRLTVADVIKRFQTYGSSDFIPGFETRYKGVVDVARRLTETIIKQGRDRLLTDIDIDV